VELVGFAERERRSLGNLGVTVLEWAFDQLRVAGTFEWHLKVQLANKKTMGEWKARTSMRVTQDLRRELDEVAVRERRTLGSFCMLLIEWDFEQHKELGSNEKLLQYKIGKRRK